MKCCLANKDGYKCRCEEVEYLLKLLPSEFSDRCVMHKGVGSVGNCEVCRSRADEYWGDEDE
jgi:hypothetical protein